MEEPDIYKKSDNKVYVFYVEHFTLPIFLLVTFWGLAGFPIHDTETIYTVLKLFLIVYAPFKIIKILIHKDHGIFRGNQTAKFIAGTLVVVLFGYVAINMILSSLLGGILASILFAYMLYMIWGTISGDDEGLY